MSWLRSLLIVVIALLAGLAHAQDDIDPTDGLDGDDGYSLSEVEAILGEVKTPGPDEILVGGYINDIHTVDLTTHSFPGDIYVWFRWTNPEFDPLETFEFMNLHDPEAHIEDVLYDEPQLMPDGSYYNVIRHQGAFSVPMDLSKYPFDSQVLEFIIEDADAGTEVVNYIPDPEGVTANDAISLPGYRIGKVREIISPKSYPTIFGDISNPETGAYSRVEFAVPITRPWQTGVIKLILPVLLIMLCAALSLSIDPNNAEGRIALVITALLTLVALQLTTSSALPEVAYLTLIDQVYIVCYGGILIILVQVARSTWFDTEPDEIAATARLDTKVLIGVGVYFVITFGLIFSKALL